MFKKYWAVIKHSLLQSFEYRAEIVSWVILSILPNFVLMLVWVSIYGKTTQLRGVTLAQMLQYFLLVTVINGLTATHFEQLRAREIREGKIDLFMTRPLSYPMMIFLKDVGGKIMYAFFLLPIFFVITFVLTKLLPIGNFNVGLPQVLLVAALLIGGYLTEFGFGLIASILTFWFEGADGLEHFKWIILTLFTGAMIPISFMPTWLRSIVTTLPLQYLYAVPIAIIQKTRTVGIFDFFYFAVFLGIMYMIAYFLWRKAIYKYSSAGG